MSGPRPAPIPFGRYRLYERIAVGGMAELFIAAADGGQPCVIKRVLPHLAQNPRFIAMFLDEAKVAAQLHHPNIARVFDLGQHDGQLYLAMEYLVGEDCARILAATSQRREKVPWRLACSLALSAAEALHHAHEAVGADGAPLQLVHRDVSPSNLLVTYGGGLKLLDFGIARWARRLEQTQVGRVKGKTGYMAPEQAQGHPVDRRADVWALGVCLYELLTGAAPRDEAAPSRLRPELPRELDAAVLAAIDPIVGARTPSALALADALRPFDAPTARDELRAWLLHLFGEARLQERLALARFDDAAAAPRVRTAPLEDASGHDPQMGVATIPLPSLQHPGADPQMLVKTAPLGDWAPPPVPAPRPVTPSRPRRARWLAGAVALVSAAAAAGSAAWQGVFDAAPVPAAQRFAVEVVSAPPDAAVYLGGEHQLPRTPAVLEGLPEGRYEVRLTKDGFKSARARFEVGPRSPRARVVATLERDDEAVAFGALEVKTTPPGAAVFLDGRLVAEATPAVVAQVLADDEHLLTVERAGFAPATARVTVEAGELQPVALTLRRELALRRADRKRPPVSRDRGLPAPGKLSLEANAPLSASLDGSHLGEAPLTVEAAAGAHALELRPPDGAPARLVRVVVKSGQTTVYRAALGRTTLDVEASPPAAVFVDGRPLGQSPVVRADIWEGRHELRVGEKTLTVDAVLGEPLKVKLGGE
ncbi:MAG: serine/threonine protein kinase [Archangiaceae bacterium]|nr:serine/threonine protein kinase [Archangiaceae bacterium]